MTLRRAGLGIVVGTILMAPSALMFEPYNGIGLYAEDPMPLVPSIPHQADDSLRHLPGAESSHCLPRY